MYDTSAETNTYDFANRLLSYTSQMNYTATNTYNGYKRGRTFFVNFSVEQIKHDNTCTSPNDIVEHNGKEYTGVYGSYGTGAEVEFEGELSGATFVIWKNY